MINFILNGSNYTMPMQMILSIGMGTPVALVDKIMLNAIITQHPHLVMMNPFLAYFIRL